MQNHVHSFSSEQYSSHYNFLASVPTHCMREDESTAPPCCLLPSARK